MSHARSEVEKLEEPWPAHSVFMSRDRPEEPPIDLYRRGTKLQIRSHVPPTYTEIDNYIAAREYPRKRRVSLAELSHRYPPTAGGLVGPPIELEVCSPIRTGTTHDKQLFKVNVPIFPDSKISLAAKFYDPLRTRDSENPQLDPFELADRSYTTEATAYECLRLLEGTMIPRYLGSYTLDAPTGWSTDTRSIRLTLYEFVEGIVMRDIPLESVQSLPQNLRKSIMYQVVEAESRIWALDVHHGDAHPRNIVLKTDARPNGKDGFESKDLITCLSDPRLSVCYIDFDNARLGEFTEDISCRSPGQGDAPISPILRWGHDTTRLERFQQMGWVDWEWQRWLEECWGDSTFYTPITLELEDEWTLAHWPKVFADQRHRVVSVRDLPKQTDINVITKRQQPPREARADSESLSSPVTPVASGTTSEEEDSRKRSPSKMRI